MTHAQFIKLLLNAQTVILWLAMAIIVVLHILAKTSLWWVVCPILLFIANYVALMFCLSYYLQPSLRGKR